MVNAEAIERIAKSHGFDIVFPDELGFAEQVGIVRDASHLVGPDGSAFYLAFFAGHGGQACVLSNQTIAVTVAEQSTLLEASGWQVTFMLGESLDEDPQYPDFADYRVDEQAFDSFLRKWLAA